MKKLILFVHGLGGSDETWGKFFELIKNDTTFKGYDVEAFTYKTSLMRVRSVTSLTSKIISLFFSLPRIFNFARVIPQQRLPKIQHIANLLKTDIEEYYGAYDEIYLVTHSMGGLVSRKYLYEMIKSKNELQIKKLMLYAVPNNGSKWAKLVSLYSHEQIEQLDGESDFLELLNDEMADIDLDEYLDVLYIIGDEDEVVSRSSAKSYHGNKKTKFLPYGHIDIVKPTDIHDRPYVVLKNFIAYTKSVTPTSMKKLDVDDVTENPFIDNVHKTLQSKRLLTLFYQDFTDVSEQQTLVKQKMQYAFGDGFYHLRIPQSMHDEAEYFRCLSDGCQFSKSIDKVHLWSDEVVKKLESSSHKICFYITSIEDGDEKLNLDFARALRSLMGEFPHFYVIIVGRRKLASLVYGKNSKLSPLNTAEWIFFDNDKEMISLDKIRQDFVSLKSQGEKLCMYLDDDIEIKWDYYSESILNTLFWRNIMNNENTKYTWRDKATKEIAKEVFQC